MSRDGCAGRNPTCGGVLTRIHTSCGRGGFVPYREHRATAMDTHLPAGAVSVPKLAYPAVASMMNA